jgi:hypothetical protein
MVEGDAVLNSLTGEIEGGQEEADALKAEAVEREEEARKVKTAGQFEGVPSKAVAQAEGNGDVNDLESKTITQLRGIANDEGVDLAGLSRKDDIIEAIEDARKSNE